MGQHLEATDRPPPRRSPEWPWETGHRSPCREWGQEEAGHEAEPTRKHIALNKVVKKPKWQNANIC